MEEGFEYLDRAEFLTNLEEDWGHCTRCGLHETRIGDPVLGVGPMDADIVFVGLGPGRNEEATGEPFVGVSGDLLDQAFYILEMDREEFRLTNSVMCRPPDYENPKKNRDPDAEELRTCRERLYEEIYAIDPIMIVALGGVAVKALCGTQVTVTKARGQIHNVKIPSHYRGNIVYPAMVTWHPAGVLRKLDIRLGDEWPILTHKDLLFPGDEYAQIVSDIYHTMEAVAYIKAMRDGIPLPQFIQDMAAYKP